MSSIKAFECLTGHISGLCTLSGKLTCFGSLSGKLSAVIDFNAYSGEYEVVPNAFNTQVLPTANKVLKKDIVGNQLAFFSCVDSHFTAAIVETLRNCNFLVSGGDLLSNGTIVFHCAS